VFGQSLQGPDRGSIDALTRAVNGQAVPWIPACPPGSLLLSWNSREISGM
jgi:hypothetical protein